MTSITVIPPDLGSRQLTSDIARVIYTHQLYSCNIIGLATRFSELSDESISHARTRGRTRTRTHTCTHMQTGRGVEHILVNISNPNLPHYEHNNIVKMDWTRWHNQADVIKSLDPAARFSLLHLDLSMANHSTNNGIFQLLFSSWIWCYWSSIWHSAPISLRAYWRKTYNTDIDTDTDTDIDTWHRHWLVNRMVAFYFCLF